MSALRSGDRMDRPSSFEVRTLLFVFFCVLFVVCLGPAVRALSRPLLSVCLFVCPSAVVDGRAFLGSLLFIVRSLVPVRPSASSVRLSVLAPPDLVPYLFSLLASCTHVVRPPLPSSVFRHPSSVFAFLSFPSLFLAYTSSHARTHARTYIRTCIHPHARTRARGLFFAHTLAAPQAGEARSRDAPGRTTLLLRYCYVTSDAASSASASASASPSIESVSLARRA